MTHPITVPLELVEEWGHDANLSGVPHNDENWAYEQHIANRAAQWGADQELEACCEWLRTKSKTALWQTEALRAARRPKQPSLKEQALNAHNRMMAGEEAQDDWAIVRRALEALDD